MFDVYLLLNFQNYLIYFFLEMLYNLQALNWVIFIHFTFNTTFSIFFPKKLTFIDLSNYLKRFQYYCKYGPKSTYIQVVNDLFSSNFGKFLTYHLAADLYMWGPWKQFFFRAIERWWYCSQLLTNFLPRENCSVPGGKTWDRPIRLADCNEVSNYIYGSWFLNSKWADPKSYLLVR